MNHRLDNPHVNIPCQAKDCRSNIHGYCHGIPDIRITEEKTHLDTYKPAKPEKRKIWSCSNYERKDDGRR